MAILNGRYTSGANSAGIVWLSIGTLLTVGLLYWIYFLYEIGVFDSREGTIATAILVPLVAFDAFCWWRWWKAKRLK
jgi:hypothetical protein